MEGRGKDRRKVDFARSRPAGKGIAAGNCAADLEETAARYQNLSIKKRGEKWGGTH